MKLAWTWAISVDGKTATAYRSVGLIRTGIVCEVLVAF